MTPSLTNDELHVSPDGRHAPRGIVAVWRISPGRVTAQRPHIRLRILFGWLEGTGFELACYGWRYRGRLDPRHPNAALPPDERFM